MKLPVSNKNLIRSVAIILPLLFISGGGVVWQLKHRGASTATGSLDRATLNQSPENLKSSGSGKGGASSATNVSGSVSAGSENSGSENSGSGSSSASSALKTEVAQEAPVTPETMKEGCFTLTFKHKSMATHSSDDECSHHRNLIKLTRTDAHPSTVCIRVNGTPVRHEAISGKTDEYVIGAVAGPNDTVTARFCVGKAKCSEACPYPKREAAKKDEFLEAISGGSNEDTGLAQWEATDAQKNNEVNQALDGDLKKAVEEHELASQRTAAGNSKLEIFKDWTSGNLAVACGTRQANEPSRSTASVRVAERPSAEKR